MRYFIDFSKYTTDQAPTGWSPLGSLGINKVVLETGSIGGKVLELANSTLFRALSLDRIQEDINDDDVEILFKASAQINNTSNLEMFGLLRGSGTSSSLSNGYMGGLINGMVRIYRISSGTATSIGSTNKSWSTNTYYWVRFRANGTDLKIKFWEDGQSEPSTWDVEVTDSNYESGLVGVGVNNYIGRKTKYDAVGIGTNSETAPSEDVLDVETNAASDIKWYGATLNGELFTYSGDQAVLSFEYGETTAYGSTVLSSNSEEGAFSAIVDDASPETTYHFRAKAVADGTTILGTDKTFTTDVQGIITANNLSPNADHTINPFISNTFTWSIMKQATQTHYEVEYRKTGDIDYISTGASETATLSHDFAADLFDHDQDYEWRVKSYDSSQSEIYDWSDIATFTTISPPTLSQKSIEQGDDIYVGVIPVSAVITSVYSRQCFLTVYVSNSSDFTEATSDFTSLKDSGQTFSVDAIFPYAGLWHVKIVAEDSTGLYTEEIITVNVTRTLFFINEPKIDLQSPQASHVTVRVKDSDPVVEYTANATPEAGANDKIERLVEIDSGTALVCQTVAEQLIERWGREQKSISGDVDLTVALSFKEKIHIIDVQSGINAEFILQEKFHNVGEMTTRITVGDIILDDSELLARILDKLK